MNQPLNNNHQPDERLIQAAEQDSRSLYNDLLTTIQNFIAKNGNGTQGATISIYAAVTNLVAFIAMNKAQSVVPHITTKELKAAFLNECGSFNTFFGEQVLVAVENNFMKHPHFIQTTGMDKIDEA